MIKYLGSKRRLVPTLGRMLTQSGARTAVDLFTGTTRVAQEFKARGALVTAVDSARYAEALARCYIGADAEAIDSGELHEALGDLNALSGQPGYVTETFCVRSRFFQPHNGARIDAIRDELERSYRDSPLYWILLTSLIEAADRVDSTTGVQMAYLKRWAPRSYRALELRAPALLAGSGTVLRGDACALAGDLPPVDLAYLDPPYNQHRYKANYHIWETLVAWDAPEHYGVACKRADLNDPANASPFNSKPRIREALRSVVEQVSARLVVLSYNDESWIGLDDLVEMCAPRGTVEVLGFDSRRYVGAQIGIHNQSGRRVGSVKRLRNTEYVLVAGERSDVRRTTAGFTEARVGTPASPVS